MTATLQSFTSDGVREVYFLSLTVKISDAGSPRGQFLHWLNPQTWDKNQS